MTTELCGDPVTLIAGDGLGTAWPFASVTVGGGSPQLWVDQRQQTSLSNPFTADGAGNARFYVAPGTYTVTFTSGTKTANVTVTAAVPSGVGTFPVLTVSGASEYVDPVIDATTATGDLFRVGRFSGAPGASRAALYSDPVGNAPAIWLLVAPNGSDYADWTFDGFNAEIDLSVAGTNTGNGNLSLRALGAGATINPPNTAGNWVQVYSISNQAGFRVGNTGGTKFLNLIQDSSNGYITNDVGDIQLRPFSGLVDFHNCPTATSVTGGSHPIPNASGFAAVKIQGFTFYFPYCAL